MTEGTGRFLGRLPQTLAVGFGSVWTLARGSVVRIDPGTNRPSARVAVPEFASSLVAGSDALWVACCAAAPSGSGSWPRLIRIDPATNTAEMFGRQSTTPAGLGVGDDSIWWIDLSEAGGISRIDSETGHVTELPTSLYARFAVPTTRWVWLIAPDGFVQRLRPDPSPDASVSTTPVRKARVALGVTYARDTIWINDGDLVGFDAMTGKLTTRLDVSGQQDHQAVAGVAILGSSAWLVDPAGQRVVRVQVRR